MFIKNYGLFWQCDDVDWGEARVRAGALLGKLPNEENRVDFRQQIGFINLYNQNQDLVYCGHSGWRDEHAIIQRLQQLRGDFVWTQFCWFGLRGVSDTHVLNPIALNLEESRETFLKQIGAIMIQLANPLENDPPNFRGAVEYEQVRDPYLDE